MLPVIEEWFIDRFPDLSGSELKRIYELCDLTSEKILNKELSITNRMEWPTICEERTRKNLADLKRFRDRIIVSDASSIQV